MAVRDAAPLLVGLLVLVHTWGAWADVNVDMEDIVKVVRGETAQIACMYTSADGIGAMTIQWFYVTRPGEKQRIYHQDATTTEIDRGTLFTERISVNGTGAPGKVVLTISNVQLKDELEFICMVKSLTDGAGEGRTKLKVFERPHHPTIEGVQTGISVNDGPSKIGTCEVKNGFPKPNITWYRNNMPLHNIRNVVDIKPSSTTESSGLFSLTSELIMKVVKENKDDLFYCEVSYSSPGGMKMTETNRINITVLYPSTALSVWVESPKDKIKEGDSIEIHCHGNGNNPSSFKIAHDDYSWETNRVVLNNVTRLNSGEYKCTSEDMETFEEIVGNTAVFVNYLDPAVVMPEDPIVLAKGEELKATCNALSSLQTHTVWFKNGEEVSRGHSLILKNTTLDTAGMYVCVVTVTEMEEMETNGTLHVSVRDPSTAVNVWVESPKGKIKEGDSIEIHCRGNGNNPSSVTITYDDYSWETNRVVLNNVTRLNSGEYKCTSEDMETFEEIVGNTTVFVNYLDPAVVMPEDPIVLAQGEDLKATCNALSSLQTHTVWFKNGEEVSRGHSLILKDTTLDTAGMYVCVVTVTEMEEMETRGTLHVSVKGSNGVFIVVIIICILLLGILGSVLYFLYKKGKICGRSGKQDLTKEKSSKDNIVVEMKSDNTEEAVLLGVNGEKQPSNDQGGEYLDVQK